MVNVIFKEFDIGILFHFLFSFCFNLMPNRKEKQEEHLLELYHAISSGLRIL